MIRVVALLFFLALASGSLRAESSCSYDQLCENISGDTGLIQSLGIFSTDPTQDPQSLKAASQRLEQVFESARRSVLLVLKEQENNDNVKEIDLIMQRVKKVKLLDHETEFSKKYSLVRENCEVPTASFSAYNFQVSFCPQSLGLPELALFTLAAHELTHSFDPCSIQHPIIQENDSSLRLLNTRDSARFNSKKDAAYLPSILSEKYPFNKILLDLVSPKSVGAFVPTAQDIFEKTQASYSQTFTSHALTIEALLEMNKSTYEKRISVIQKYYPKYKYCADFSGFSFASEAFADWVASKAVNKKLIDLERERIEPEQLQTMARSFLTPFWQRCAQFTKIQPDKFHISEKNRVEKIFLAQPQLDKYLCR